MSGGRSSVLRAAVVAAALLSIAASAVRAGDDPDPLEILKKADAATLAVTSASYRAEYFGTGGLAQRPRATGTVKLRAARRGLLGALRGKDSEQRPSLRITGEWTDPRAEFVRTFDVATDGRHVVSISPSDKQYVTATAQSGEALIKHATSLYMIEFLHPAPFNDEIVGHWRKYEGTQDIAGEPCHVIYVKYLNDTESRWFFSVNDHLPRRVDRIVKAPGVDGAISLQISDLAVGVSFSPDVFHPRVPAGFKKAEFKPPHDRDPIKPGVKAPDWKLKTPDGRTVTLNDLKGKIVVLQFWSPESYPSLIAMPGTQWLAERFRDQPVQIYALTCQQGDRDAAKCLDEKQIKVPLLLNADDVAKQYHVTAMPTTYVLCPMGYVISAERGYQYKAEERIATTVDSVLKSMPAKE